jgi:hypothetical protein
MKLFNQISMLVLATILGSVSLAKDKTATISREVKIEVCKGAAIQLAIDDLGQQDPYVKNITSVPDDTIPANQMKYLVVLTELNDHDFYSYEVVVELSANPAQCRKVVVDAIPVGL